MWTEQDSPYIYLYNTWKRQGQRQSLLMAINLVLWPVSRSLHHGIQTPEKVRRVTRPQRWRKHQVLCSTHMGQTLTAVSCISMWCQTCHSSWKWSLCYGVMGMKVRACRWACMDLRTPFAAELCSWRRWRWPSVNFTPLSHRIFLLYYVSSISFLTNPE